MHALMFRVWEATERAKARVRDEEGQTATEYLGVLAVVVAIIAGVLALAPGIGSTIGNDITSEVGKVLG